MSNVMCVREKNMLVILAEITWPQMSNVCINTVHTFLSDQ